MRNRRFLAIALVLALTGTCAYLAARGFLKFRREQEIAEIRERNRESHLNDLVGIEIGMMFPDLVLSSFEDSSVHSLANLAPECGILLLLDPGCANCRDLAKDVSRLVAESPNLRSQMMAISLPAPDTALLELSADLSAVRTYVDRDSALVKGFHFVASPMVVALDADGRVTNLGSAWQLSYIIDEQQDCLATTAKSDQL